MTALIEAQSNRRQCYICGTDLNPYNPKETHHMALRGMGGSPALETDDNEVDICTACHRCIHGPQPTLLIKREDDGLLWVYRKKNGAWYREVPYGRLLTGEDVSTDLWNTEEISVYLGQQMSNFAEWNDEALREQYMIFQHVGTSLFATQCLIIHILSERRESVDSEKRSGIATAAKFLGISYQTARVRHAIWRSILSKVTSDELWKGLSPDFYYKAYSWKGKGVDPVKALDYAEGKVLANKEYTPTKFQRDLEEGLPDKDTGKSVLSGCPYQCIHYRAASTDGELVLYEGPVKVARGYGGGHKYCAKKMLLLADIDTSSQCEFFEQRR